MPLVRDKGRAQGPAAMKGGSLGFLSTSRQSAGLFFLKLAFHRIKERKTEIRIKETIFVIYVPPFQTGLETPMWRSVLLVNLTKCTITWEVDLWACMWGVFLITFIEIGRPILIVGRV